MEIIMDNKDRACTMKLQGRTNKEIARDLKISLATVTRYTKHLTDSIEEIINLTPHDIIIGDMVFESKGVLRANKIYKPIMSVKGLPTYKMVFEKRDVLELPRQRPNRIYIVSNQTAGAYPDRPDLYTVYNKGEILGNNVVDGLTRNPFFIHKK